MATWIAPKQDWIGDDILPASNMNDIGGDLQFLYEWLGALGIAEKSDANQTGITIEADLTGLSVTITVPAGGRRIRISVMVMVAQVTSDGAVRVILYEDAVALRDVGRETLVAGTRHIVSGSAIRTPSAGSHTYKLRALTSAGTLETRVTSTDGPAFILVEGL